ncbi:hypothetical protein QR680_005594 [Steinernema hermaphroditum]|uniref:TASOR pseudo-PARP domain-containing protein n=1 Tax=Steinernema hermaphroditum TaxID=289476 RepID=A0AA39HSL3_9BILA|nr:hypothetical protein QR680_005594 [Steinernema hermaphroditum]
MSGFDAATFVDKAKLANFTIPIKRKTIQEDVGKEFKLVELKLDFSNLKLNAIKEIVTSHAYNSKQMFSFQSVKLVENSRLDRNFSNRKKEFITAGISNFVCKHGLAVGSNFLGELGSHEQGVYVSRHSDLISPAPYFDGMSVKMLIVKLLLGKSKEVGLGSCDLDADPSYNSHFTQWPNNAQKSRLSRFELYRYNRLFVYEHDSSANVVPFPRSVLPYAVITLNCKSSTYRLCGATVSNVPVWSGVVGFGSSCATKVECSIHACNRAPTPLIPNVVLDLSMLVPWDQCVRSHCLSALLSPTSIRYVSYYILSSRSKEVSREFNKMVNTMRTEHCASVYLSPDMTQWFVIPNGELSSDLSLPSFSYAVFHILTFSHNPQVRASRLNLPDEGEYKKSGPLLGQRIDASSAAVTDIYNNLWKKRVAKKDDPQKSTEKEEEPESSSAKEQTMDGETIILGIDDDEEEYEPEEKKPPFTMTSEQIYLVKSLPKMDSFPNGPKKNTASANIHDAHSTERISDNNGDREEQEKDSAMAVEHDTFASSANKADEGTRPLSPVGLYAPRPAASEYVPQPPPNFYEPILSPASPSADCADSFISTSNLYKTYEPSWGYSASPTAVADGNDDSSIDDFRTNGFGMSGGFNTGSIDLYAYRPRSNSPEPVNIPVGREFAESPMSPPKSDLTEFSKDVDMRPMFCRIPPFCEASTSAFPPPQVPQPASPWINGQGPVPSDVPCPPQQGPTSRPPLLNRITSSTPQEDLFERPFTPRAPQQSPPTRNEHTRQGRRRFGLPAIPVGREPPVGAVSFPSLSHSDRLASSCFEVSSTSFGVGFPSSFIITAVTSFDVGAMSWDFGASAWRRRRALVGSAERADKDASAPLFHLRLPVAQLRGNPSTADGESEETFPICWQPCRI